MDNYSEIELLEIANAVFDQMGGIKSISSMIGAWNFKSVNENNNVSVSWSFKGSKTFNFVKVLYTPMDTYIMQIGQLRKIKGIPTMVIRKEQDDLYCEDIKAYFEKETGLYLTLF